ncbi:Bax inhibitor-1/YccA family protein [Thioalkalivibrio sp. HK1]|uniref:Bax inhibitor-1/YccA family protein n=1 Tax=Thioalkalivibrio sp. HK1 TaxID=1469245 RepID=UPI00056FFE58|nr:Bax inhibitor-1/YccA family protein [Thioalkalivibrio sp. HK1]
MDMQDRVLRARGLDTTLATNKLIRNTYSLLAMTLAFSALTAGIGIVANIGHFPWFITLGGFFGLLFMVHKNAERSSALIWVFALTGFMGLTIGPVVNLYLETHLNGGEVVMTAFGSTAVIFLGLSGYALTSKRDFSFMGGFLMVGMLVVILASLGSIFFSLPGLHLALSAMIVLLMSGFILYETSQLVHNPNTNYILATVSLYVSIYNIFLSLLHIFGAFSGGDD